MSVKSLYAITYSFIANSLNLLPPLASALASALKYLASKLTYYSLFFAAGIPAGKFFN
jgi:hypothetical protein